MLLQNVNNFILCRVFPKTLTRLVQKWYQRLPYMSRFNTKAIQIENLNHETTCEAMKEGSNNIKFVDSLTKNPALDYEQLIEKAQKCIRLDDERMQNNVKRRKKNGTKFR
ncbi:hypothetical protein P3X46_033528 [Hevea brasiliensis]|uniref:Uncharacterized protein n=1 Tax=Hevea brasiliensis TaxID=3981 RepID=A0ABQ9KBJ9_HEVBR|nr:hypothetical protein P3X46_033528 [Hevea brasiliensis]